MSQIFKRALSSISWGSKKQNNYANAQETRETLSTLLHKYADDDPKFSGEGTSASCESGLHPTSKDPRLHWTWRFWNQSMEKLGTRHITMDDVIHYFGEKPACLEAEEKRVLEALAKKEKAEQEKSSGATSEQSGPHGKEK